MSAAIREIRRIYPAACITLVIDKRAENLAEHCPYIDELIVGNFRLNGHSLQSLTYQYLLPMYEINFKLAQNLLTRRYDIAFAFAHHVSPTVPLLAYMSGAKERVSNINNILTPLVTQTIERVYGNHHVELALAYIENLIRLPIANRELEAWVDDVDLETVKQLLPSAEKIYVIGLGGGFPKKLLPPKTYAHLMTMIMREDDSIRFVLVGGEPEIDSAKILMSHVDGSRVVNLVGKISYRQTTAVLDSGDMYIGNDTAAMHLASATNTPVLVPFCFPLELRRPLVSLDRWYPYGVPSVIVCPAHALAECKDSKNFYGCNDDDKPHCITQITPHDMFRGYKLLLERIAEGNCEPLVIGSE